jgi:sugar phosphate isomerase/epimerase
MKTIKGPAIFLAQFAGDQAPFNSLAAIARWAADLGYEGVQIPSWDGRLFDLKRAAESDAYCDEVKGTLADAGVALTELSTHLQGQLVAVHPAYDAGFDAFAAPEARGNPKARQEWAVQQMRQAAEASRRLGLDAHVTFSGALAWPYVYPWPPRPSGLIEIAFDELAKRWRPILDAFDEQGVDVGYEIHPGEDLMDGASFEMFLERVGNHPRCCINYDPSPKQGVYSGFQPWLNRAGRFRSLGDGQVDFGAIFSKLAGYDYGSWAVLEWECCLKHPEDGAREGAEFIAAHIIRVTETSFEDFIGQGADQAANRRMLGIG